MQAVCLQIDKISYSYPDGQPILQGIDLEIKRNDLVVIRGESGVGKSTFLKLFNRFCDITEGNILFHGNPLKDYHIDALRSAVIYLPQLPLMINGSIQDNLHFPFRFHSNRHKTFDTTAAEKWLTYFQLDMTLDQNALKLSIGQRQRIALIRSLLLEPEVLLLDEPGSALDPNNKRLIEQKIEAIAGEDNVTVIMATHSDVSFSASRYRKLNLENGKLGEM